HIIWSMEKDKDLRHGRHCVFAMHVHLVFVTKYRRCLLFSKVCSDFAAVLVQLDGEGNRSEEHTSELQSLAYLVCRLLLEKKKCRRKKPARPMRRTRVGSAVARAFGAFHLFAFTNCHLPLSCSVESSSVSASADAETDAGASVLFPRAQPRAWACRSSRPESKNRTEFLKVIAGRTWSSTCRRSCEPNSFFFLMGRPPPSSPLFPYTTLFR